MDNESKVFIFLDKPDITVGVEFVKNFKTDSVNFRIASAISNDVFTSFYEEEGETTYNLLNNAEIVPSFDEATILAVGTIFISDNPIAVVRGEAVNYTVSILKTLWFKNEFEALTDLIKNEVVMNGALVLAGQKLNTDFIYDTNE